MTRATLAEVLAPCLTDGTAIAGVVVLGWEDARAFVQAAEAEARPIILQAGPGCRAHTPLAVIAAMFRHLADTASVPVVTHLDHGEDAATCQQAIDLGFTSVMYDGSSRPFAENVAATAAIVAVAHAAGVSVEAELGFVGYAGGAPSQGTDPDEACRFHAQTGVDALAVSVGNVHLMTGGSAALDLPRLHRIADLCPTLPLVLHGGSGIAADLRRSLAARTTVCKVNLGTELRQSFGHALRTTLARHPDRFDRIQILAETIPPMVTAARAAIRSLCAIPPEPAPPRR